MEPSRDNVLSRRDFLKLAGLGAAGVAASGFLGNQLAEALRLLAELKRSEYPDIPLPKKQEKEIQGLTSLAADVSTTVAREESIHVERTDMARFIPILVSQIWGYNFMREKVHHYPESYKQWIADEKYPLSEHPIEIVGDDQDSKEFARKILDTYVTKDQSRISTVLLEQTNETGSYGNVVRWEIGRYPLELWKQAPKDLSTIVKSFIHELSHATTPLSPIVKIGEKMALIPYGFTRSMAFIKGWLTAIQTDYSFFQSRFFRAKGDGTLPLIQEGKLGEAVNEMMAMLVTDAVFPGGSVANLPEITKANVFTSLGYIRNGVNGGNITDDEVVEVQRTLESVLSS